MRQLIPNNPEHKVSFWFFCGVCAGQACVILFFFFYPFAILFLYPSRTFNMYISSEWRTVVPEMSVMTFSCEHVIKNWKQMNFISFMLLEYKCIEYRLQLLTKMNTNELDIRKWIQMSWIYEYEYKWVGYRLLTN